MNVRAPSGGPRSRRLLVWLALGLWVLATGCSIKAGNMKEYRQRKRQLREARAQAEQAAMEQAAEQAAADTGAEEAAPDEPIEGTEAAAEGTAPAGPATSAAETAGVSPRVVGEEMIDADLLGHLFLASRRDAGGGLERTLLREPLVGHYERTFRSGGGVVDRAVVDSAFVFRVGNGFEKVKIHKLDRVEVLADAGVGRDGIRLRFHFRKPTKGPQEFPARLLVGSDHPIPPFLEGIGPKGIVRIPLFAPPGQPAFLPLVEVDFTLEAGT